MASPLLRLLFMLLFRLFPRLAILPPFIRLKDEDRLLVRLFGRLFGRLFDRLCRPLLFSS